MKYFILFSLSIFINSLSAQAWKEMKDDPSVNIYDVVKEAEAYFANVDKDAKGSGWKGYQRWLFENEPKFYPTGDRSKVDPYFVSKAYKGFLKTNANANKTLFDNGWEELGPHYIEQVTQHYSVGLGRIECFYADPTDTNRIYLGSRSGGFWKTLDGGTTWTGSTTDTLFASGVNTMTVSPTNPDSILINVRNSRNGTSHGIYRSADAGDSWTETNFNPTNLGWGGLGSYSNIYQIAYHPTIKNMVIIGTQEGLYRSTDDMNTWTLVIPTYDFKAIGFHPTDPSVIYAVTSNIDHKIYLSSDTGATFTTSNTIFSNNSDLRISISAACPDCVYLASSGGVWKSNDKGVNFSFISTLNKSNYGAFVVSDVDTNTMLFGDIDLHRSTNEGVSFSKATTWYFGNANYNTTGKYVHADIRGGKCQNGVFWVNTDGLLCKSTDNGITWQIYEGQSIRENYNLGVSQSNHYTTISGSQDNGTSIKKKSTWVEFYGADGMEGIIHPLNDDWMIGSYQYGGRRRTIDGGITALTTTNSAHSGAWIAPLFYDPNDQMTVYTLGSSVFKSDDFGLNWTIKGSPSFSGDITYAAIAENNTNIMVVSNYSNIEKSLDGGSTFSSIKSNLPNSTITDIAFDPNNDSVIVVVYGTYQNNSSKVYITNNLGVTWQNISYNINDMPIRSVVIDHTNASTIYLGAEIGVYKKAMADTTWSLYNTNLPNMSVLELEVMYGSNTLRAATWGRGVWEYTLDGRKNYPTILTTRITDQPTVTQPITGTNQFVTSTIASDDSISTAFIKWSVGSPTFTNTISMANTVDSTWVSTLPIPSQSAGTKVYFKVYAVGMFGDTTETYKYMYELKEGCKSSGNMLFNTAVTQVDFNTISNASGKLLPYTDYTPTISTRISLGGSYNLSVNLNTDGKNTTYSKAWIDWNRDHLLDPATEEYSLGSVYNDTNGQTSLSPLVINVPLTASLGESYMRVSGRRSQFPIPCGQSFNGEVEDYKIIIEKMFLVDSSYFNICSGDSIYAGGDWQKSSGTYYDTVYISSTTDSLYVTELDINNINTLVTQSGNTLTANDSGATYQWLVCPSMDPILGATNRSYTAIQNADYAVAISKNGCTDTSACYTVSGIGIVENNYGEKFIVYPNPTNGKLSIDLGDMYSSSSVTVTDVSGKTIYSNLFRNHQLIQIEINAESGVYFLMIESEEKKAIVRLVKE